MFPEIDSCSLYLLLTCLGMFLEIDSYSLCLLVPVWRCFPTSRVTACICLFLFGGVSRNRQPVFACPYLGMFPKIDSLSLLVPVWGCFPKSTACICSFLFGHVSRKRAALQISISCQIYPCHSIA